jgi:hypothetical protein
MEKNRNNPDIEHKIKKTKRNKRKTECNVIRSKTGCGICGSENVAYQGVAYCKNCGSEIDYLTESRYGLFFGRNIVEPSCDCYIEYKSLNRNRHYRPIGYIGVAKCMDCGAVMGRFCPNEIRHDCWKHWNGRVYCRDCGFRI